MKVSIKNKICAGFGQVAEFQPEQLWLFGSPAWSHPGSNRVRFFPS